MLFKPIIQNVQRYNAKVDTKVIGAWLDSHVGTVHTFQGKQAEGVILCLGLDGKTKGAANWAASKPNLLNVALTRAKYRFVAIGDKDIWLKVQFFKELAYLN
jgi:superfamily I DNA and/or RNA helicase